MYSFEGEFRRRPQQNLGGASRKVELDELLHKAQSERNQREEKRRVIQSATAIQSFVRGCRERQVEKQKRRAEFDEIAKNHDFSSLPKTADAFSSLTVRLLYFYDELQDDSRLAHVVQIFLKDTVHIVCFLLTNPENWLYKIQKLLLINMLRLKKSVSPSANIALPLRFIEVYTAVDSYDNNNVDSTIQVSYGVTHNSNIVFKLLEKIWNFLIRHNYFAILRIVLDNRVPDSLIVSVRPPTPLASSLLNLFSRALLFESKKKPAFVQMLLQDVFTEELSPQISCFLLPALVTQPNLITIDALLTAILPDNLSFNFNATSSLLYTYIYIVCKHAKFLTEHQTVEYLISLRFLLQSVSFTSQVIEGGYASDEDDESRIPPDNSQERHAFQEEIIDLINELDHVNMLLPILENEKSFQQCVVSICCMSHLLLNHQKLAIHNYRLLYTLAFKPSFLRMLWRSILSNHSSSVFGSPTPMLQILNQGMILSSNDQESFIPQLIIFCAFLNHMLSTLHDFEFYDENEDSKTNVSMMPFKLTELASISGTLRDVCMGLIERAYPESRSSYNKDYSKGTKGGGLRSIARHDNMQDVRQWNQLFKVVITLLRQLYSRDCRQRFCPEGQWIARQFPVFFERATELHFSNRREHGYQPFIGLHHFTREQLEVEGPPPSAIEARQLAILREFPFAIRFHDRFRIFQTLILKDKQENQGEMRNFDMGPQIRITIRRNFIYEDAFGALSYQSQPSMKPRVLVQLVNVVGLDEVGIDGGGIFREFLNELLKTCFDPNRGFFQTTHDCLLYPNPSVHRVVSDFSKHYFFIGRMLGKAIYENMLVELPFAGFFLSKLLSRNSSDVDIQHLASLDPVMYRNLLYLKSYDGDVADLGLDFTVMNSEFGENEIVELKPGGANIPVTESNRITYIHLMADFKLNKQIKAQCRAFKEGLANVIDMEWLYMFDPNELQILISGAQTPIDLDDLKANTNYSGGYTVEHPVICAFWKVVEGFDERQRRQLLKFVTSCSRAPLLGFKELVPGFCIQNAGRENRLPTASTCMNLLKLPEFDDEETLKMKLVYAVESGAGFELS